MSLHASPKDLRHIPSIQASSTAPLEVDAGPLPPPYGTPSPPVPPPAPRMLPATQNSTSISLSQPISISGSHNEINLSLPLESLLRNVLSANGHMSNTAPRQNSTKPFRTGGVTVMLHCPVNIVGDCNTVNMEAEQEKVVYVPVPVPQRIQHTWPMQGVPTSIPINPQNTVIKQPEQQSRKRRAEVFDSPVDAAPFTKRQQLEAENDDDDDDDDDEEEEEEEEEEETAVEERTADQPERDLRVAQDENERPRNQNMLDELRLANAKMNEKYRS